MIGHCTWAGNRKAHAGCEFRAVISCVDRRTGYTLYTVRCWSCAYKPAGRRGPECSYRQGARSLTCPVSGRLPRLSASEARPPACVHRAFRPCQLLSNAIRPTCVPPANGNGAPLRNVAKYPRNKSWAAEIGAVGGCRGYQRNGLAGRGKSRKTSGALNALSGSLTGPARKNLDT